VDCPVSVRQQIGGDEHATPLAVDMIGDMIGLFGGLLELRCCRLRRVDRHFRWATRPPQTNTLNNGEPDKLDHS
jgi:hypothetical protein